MALTFEVSVNVYHASSSPQLFRIVATLKMAVGNTLILLQKKLLCQTSGKSVVAGFAPRFSEPVEKFSLMLLFPLDADFTYYVDEVKILSSDMVETPGVVLKNDFEENTGSWQPRGEPVSIETTDKVAHGGKSHCVLKEGRVAGREPK